MPKFFLEVFFFERSTARVFFQRFFRVTEQLYENPKRNFKRHAHVAAAIREVMGMEEEKDKDNKAMIIGPKENSKQ